MTSTRLLYTLLFFLANCHTAMLFSMDNEKLKELFQKWKSAWYSNDVAGIKACLAENPTLKPDEITLAIPEQEPALFVAIRTLCPLKFPIIKTLLEAGANPTLTSRSKDKFALQALMHRTICVPADNHLCQTALKLLLEYSADPHQVDDKWRTALHMATQMKLEEQVKILLAFGASKNTATMLVSLLLAVSSKDGRIVQSLLSHASSPFFTSALTTAAQANSLDMAQLLIVYGGSEHIPPHRHFSYTYSSNVEVSRFLLAHTPKARPANDVISRLLGHSVKKAAFKGQVAHLLELLNGQCSHYLTRQAAQASRHITALHWAAARGHERIIEKLLDHGALINALDPYDETPLDLALFNNQILCTKLLKDRGGVHNLYNPLWWAVHKERLIATHELLETDPGKSLINSQDKYGNTPMHRVAAQRHLCLVEWLLRKNGDIYIKNQIGTSPLEILSANQHFTSLQPYVGPELVGPLLRILSKSETPEVKAVGQTNELCFHIGGHLADLHYPASYQLPETYPCKRVLLIETIHRLQAVAKDIL